MTSAAMDPADPVNPQNQILGSRYRILHHLGGGGFGQTYLAEDQHLPGKPRCVVKRLQPRTTDTISLEAARRLFDAEAQALYRLGTHDQIPHLLAHFEEAAQFYLVQEYVEGTLLTAEIRSGNALPEQRVVELLVDVLTTLVAVHEQGVIHRDIKPSNLIRRHRDGKIVIIDFGSVKQVSAQPQTQQGPVTMTVAIGSQGYMPNEQLAGQPSLSSDIYAVGMMAIQALTGLDPRRIPKDPRNSEVLWRGLAAVAPPLAEVLDKMVRYDFRQRYPSAREALHALQGAIALSGGRLSGSFSAGFSGGIAGGGVANFSGGSSGGIPGAGVANFSGGFSSGLSGGLSGGNGSTSGGGRPILSSGVTSHGGHLAWLERADELFQGGRFADAVVWYQKVVQAEPEDTTAWFKLAMAQENLGSLEGAIAAYERVLTLQPEDYLAWLKRGKALEQLGQWAGAIAAYLEVLRIQPDNYWAWNDLGQAQEHQGDLEGAIAAYTRAVQLQADFPVAQENRKRLLVALKQVETLYSLNCYEETIAACDQAIRDNNQDVNAWMMRAMALENLRRIPEATLAYNRVVQLTPEDAVTWFKLGSLLETLQKPKQAAIAFANVVRLQPSNHWAWMQRGRMLEQLGQTREAITAYQQALQIKPDYAAAQKACDSLLGKTVSPVWGRVGLGHQAAHS